MGTNPDNKRNYQIMTQEVLIFKLLDTSLYGTSITHSELRSHAQFIKNAICEEDMLEEKWIAGYHVDYCTSKLEMGRKFKQIHAKGFNRNLNTDLVIMIGEGHSEFIAIKRMITLNEIIK